MEQSDNETLAIKAKPIEEVKIKEFLNIADASKLLGVSWWTLQRLIKRRALPAIKFGIVPLSAEAIRKILTFHIPNDLEL
ncbi:MerR family transcriptional regulator [Chitinophaga flava]|nr:helix-turn-helix domain-containing protein [Chitinophaga flava]